jgi:type I restriction enzyme S subunit
MTWPMKRIADVVQPTESIDPGQTPNKEFDYIDVSSTSNKTYQVVSTQRLKGQDAPSRARRLVRSDDVIFATIRPTLQRLALISSDLDQSVCSTGYVVLRPGPCVKPKYLFYALLRNEFRHQMEQLQKGASYPAVLDSEVKSHLFPVPPIPEQKRIVAILDEAFAGINAAIMNAEMNLDNGRVLFESYRDSVFAQKDEGWTEKQFAAIASIKHGYPFQSRYFVEDGKYVLLTPGNFYETGGYRDRGNKQKFYNGPVPEGYVLQKGDMLLAMTEQAAGLLGSPAIVPEDQLFLHNQRLGLVVPHEETPWCNRFFFHAFNTAAFRRKVHDDASGVKVRHTSPKKLGDVKLAFPQSLAQQIAVANRLDECARQTSALEVLGQHKLSALAELKQSILQKAFAGELTANEVERELAAA